MHSLSDAQPILEYQTPRTTREERHRRILDWLVSARVPAVLVQICFVVGLVLGTGKGDSGWMLTLPIWMGGAWYAVARIARSKAARWAKYHLAIAAAVALLAGVTLVTPGRAPSLPWGNGLAASHDSSAARDMLRHGWRGHFTSDLDRATVMTTRAAVAWFLIVQVVERAGRTRPRELDAGS